MTMLINKTLCLIVTFKPKPNSSGGRDWECKTIDIIVMFYLCHADTYPAAYPWHAYAWWHPHSHRHANA